MSENPYGSKANIFNRKKTLIEWKLSPDKTDGYLYSNLMRLQQEQQNKFVPSLASL